MRIFQVAALYCFLVAVTIGSAVGDGACPEVTEGHELLPFSYDLELIGDKCFEAFIGDTTALQVDNLTTATIQSFFNTMCPRAPAFRVCLAEKTSSLAVCTNSSIQKTFDIFRDLAVTTVETGCAEGGKLIVNQIKAFYAIRDSRSSRDTHTKCISKSMTISNTLENINLDFPSKLFILHKEIGKYKDCVGNIQLELSLKESFDDLLNTLMTTMKCVHPEDGSLVTCASIPIGLICAPSLCQTNTHGSIFDVYDRLEGDAAKCFNGILMDDDRLQDVTANSEALHAEYETYCRDYLMSHRCEDYAKTLSETCLSVAEQNEYNLLMSNIKRGLEAGCVEDGRRLGDVMFEVYRLKRTGQGHAVWDCVDVAKATRNDLDEHRSSSSKNMRFYHELESFKTCLVGKLHGDPTSVDAATSLIDEMLNKLECPGVEGGATVTCQSLMNHHH